MKTDILELGHVYSFVLLEMFMFVIEYVLAWQLCLQVNRASAKECTDSYLGSSPSSVQHVVFRL